MDYPKRPNDKTYSDVMNEWAAQRHLFNADRNRLLHPPFDASPAARFFGYLVRIALVTLVPGAIYLFLLVSYLGSQEFNTMLSTGIAQTLGAEKVETRGAGWKFDGILSMKSLTAVGGPGAIYSDLEAKNLGTRVPFPALFRRDWVLPRVSLGELTIALRSGGMGKVPAYQSDEEGLRLPSAAEEASPGTPKTGALSPSPKGLLRAGYGVSPDFNSLKINELQMAVMNLTWGSGPATAGALTGMQTNLTRTTAGWVVSGDGGEFRQGWLDGMQIDKLSMKLLAGEAEIENATMVRAGGGKGSFTGRLKYGEVPEIDGVIQLEGVSLQGMVPTAVAGLFTAEGNGSLKLSGSVNRTTGIRMEGEVEVLSGRLAALPVLKALNHLTKEDQFRLLVIRSGKIRFTTSGAEGHGGQVVEVKELEADCGSLARIKGSLKYEHVRGIGDIEGTEAVDRMEVTGVIRLGLSTHVSTLLKPAIVERFLKKDEAGWFWLDLPVEEPLTANFTKEIAADLLKFSAAAPGGN